jgi:hypothetical protein
MNLPPKSNIVLKFTHYLIVVLITTLLMKKLFLFSLFIVFISACKQSAPSTIDTEAEKLKISNLLDTLNSTAAKADFDAYFSLYTKDAIFAGTDASERWDHAAFKVWAKPYFDKGEAWNFSVIERNIFIDASGQFAWFDELLNTQMKICRGSGVLVKENNNWKIKQYILSTTVPNDQLDSVIKIKAPIEDSLIEKLSKK